VEVNYANAPITLKHAYFVFWTVMLTLGVIIFGIMAHVTTRDDDGDRPFWFPSKSSYPVNPQIRLGWNCLLNRLKRSNIA
jgi:hypothetical protein